MAGDLLKGRRTELRGGVKCSPTFLWFLGQKLPTRAGEAQQACNKKSSRVPITKKKKKMLKEDLRGAKPEGIKQG